MRSAKDIEADRLREQARLDRATPPGQRNRAGQFATPAALAQEIVRYCLECWQTHPRPVRFLEPCLGTGSFYSALRRIFPAPLLAAASGYEIDRAHADVARSLWQETGLTVNVADFTKEPPPRTKYNLLITNPPYVRHHHLDRTQKERLQALVKERVGLALSGLAGLYCYFLLLADAWLEEFGLSVWLIPSEFMDVNYGTAVKQGSANASCSVTFGELFTIRRGVATGNNDFFILARDQARRLARPETCLRPILPAPRLLPETVIEADADGYPRLEPQLALLDCSLPEHVVENRFPALWRYLQEGQQQHIHEGYLTSRRTPWYAQEHRPPPPFLCTYMGRNSNGRKPFRFLWNKSQATAHNVYLLLYPEGLLREWLKQDRSLQGRVFAALREFDTNTLTGGGRVYGGGLFQMEPKELANTPADFLLKALALDPPRERPRQKALFDHFDSPSAPT